MYFKKWNLFIGLYSTVKIFWKIINRLLVDDNIVASHPDRRVLIVGARQAGTFISSVKVRESRYVIARFAKEENVDEIIISISKIEKIELRNIIEECKDSQAKVKIMPGVSEMIDGKMSI